MKKAVLLALATVLLALSAAVQAQNPPAPPREPQPPHGPMMGFGPMLHHGFWKNSEIAAKLNLTDAQRTQLESIFASHRDDFRATHQQMKAAMDAVRQTLDAPQVDEAAYNANVAKVVALHSQVAQQFASLTLAYRKVLTVDQWKTLEQMEQQHREDFKVFHERHGDQNMPPEPPQ